MKLPVYRDADFFQVGKGVGGLASGVWGGVSGKNVKDQDAEAAKQEAGEAEEGEEEEGSKEEASGKKGGFF